MIHLLFLAIAFANDVSEESSGETADESSEEQVVVEEEVVLKKTVTTPPQPSITEVLPTETAKTSKKRFSFFKRKKGSAVSNPFSTSVPEVATPREYAVYTDYKVVDVPFEDRGWNVEETVDRDVTDGVTKTQRNILFTTAGTFVALYVASSVLTSGVEEEYNDAVLEYESTTAKPVTELEDKLNLYKLVGNVILVGALGNVSGGVYKHLQIGKEDDTSATKTSTSETSEAK